MLDSIYHMTLELIKNFSMKTSLFCHLLHNVIMDVFTLYYTICKPLVVCKPRHVKFLKKKCGTVRRKSMIFLKNPLNSSKCFLPSPCLRTSSIPL